MMFWSLRLSLSKPQFTPLGVCVDRNRSLGDMSESCEIFDFSMNSERVILDRLQDFSFCDPFFCM